MMNSKSFDVSRAHACLNNENKGHESRLRGEKNVVMEGLMEKRGVWIRSWKSRYFVLEGNGRLRYFRSEADKSFPEREQGAIPISMDIVVEPAESKTGRTYIKISASDGPTLKLSALSEDSHRRWIVELQKVQNSMLFVSSTLS